MSRIFGLISTLIVLGAILYLYSRQVQTSSAAMGTNNPKAAINVTGVRTDLMTIAQAERGYFALQGKYASLDELISSRSIAVAHQRPPYSYDVEVSSGGFRVIATRSGDDASGTPAQISVDENMQFATTQ